MSLINEALKKAQRMRHQEPGGAPPPPTDAAGTSVPPVASMPLRRGRTPASQTLLLFAGVPLLVLVSVGVTWWLLRPATPVEAPVIANADVPAKAAPASADPAAAQTPTVAIQPVALPPPANTVAAAPSTPAATSAPIADTAVPPASAPLVPAPSATSPAETPEQASKPDSRVHAFLDTLRVSGIRASATDPRVSMNGRVFRLNDIVDRNLELRIIAIAPEGLTFIGPDGVVYQTQF